MYKNRAIEEMIEKTNSGFKAVLVTGPRQVGKSFPYANNAFDVLERIPDRKRGNGAIICLYDKPLWLKENIIALPVEFI